MAEPATKRADTNIGRQERDPRFGWLYKRGEYLALRKAERITLRDMVLLCGRSPTGDLEKPPRFGITVTRQAANAVGRNRIRRRLRSVIASVAPKARRGHDHVVLARTSALSARFDELVEQLSTGLDRAARSGKRRGPGAPKNPGRPRN